MASVSVHTKPKSTMCLIHSNNISPVLLAWPCSLPPMHGLAGSSTMM